MSVQGKYIYGVIKEPVEKQFDIRGVQDAPVRTIACDGLAAVVSDIDVKEIYPMRRNVQAHTAVQDNLLNRYTVLPMAFGMIAESQDEVRGLLELNHRELVSQLKELADKIEIELHAFWDPEAVIKHLQGTSNELALLRARVATVKTPGDIQALLIDAGRQVEQITQNWKTQYVEQVYSALRQLASDARLNRTMGVKNLMSASFLVEKAKQPAFREEVCRLDARSEGRVNYKYIGPLPPYNFVDIKLRPVK